jgi:hypothetical protein
MQDRGVVCIRALTGGNHAWHNSRKVDYGSYDVKSSLGWVCKAAPDRSVGAPGPGFNLSPCYSSTQSQELARRSQSGRAPARIACRFMAGSTAWRTSSWCRIWKSLPSRGRASNSWPTTPCDGGSVVISRTSASTERFLFCGCLTDFLIRSNASRSASCASRRTTYIGILVFAQCCSDLLVDLGVAGRGNQ